MKCFKVFADHDNKFSEYIATAYVLCITDTIKLMTKKGIKAAILVLIKAKNLYGLLTSSS